MVDWIMCECGKPIDEFESKCHWCGRPSSLPEDDDGSSDTEPQGD